MKMRLDHIGVIVRDLDEARRYYQDHFGFNDFSPLVDEPAQKVKIVFVWPGPADFPMIELIQPITEDSVVYNFLKKTGGGLHHLSYEVADLDQAIEHFKGLKAVMVGKIYPGAGHHGQRVIWFYTSAKELIELIEEKRDV